MLRSAAALLLVCLPAVAQTEPPSPWQFIHPGAEFIVGANVHTLAASPFIAELKREFRSSKVTGNTEIFDDIDFVLLSAPASKAGTSQGLAFVRTRTSATKLLESASLPPLRKQTYNDYTVLMPKTGDSTELRVALLDQRHLLFGDWASLRAVLQPARKSAEGGLLERAQVLYTTADLWLVADTSKATGSGNNLLDAVRGAEATIILARQARLQLALTTETPEKAAGIGAMISLLTEGVGNSFPVPQVKTSGNRVEVALAVTAAQLRGASERFGRQLVARAGAAFGLQGAAEQDATPTATARVAPPVEPVLPPEKQVVRIHGLDEGVREIPLVRP